MFYLLFTEGDVSCDDDFFTVRQAASVAAELGVSCFIHDADTHSPVAFYDAVSGQTRKVEGWRIAA